jgi:hypothetical protein
VSRRVPESASQVPLCPHGGTGRPVASAPSFAHGRRVRRQRALHGRIGAVGAPDASQESGGCKRQSSSHPANGRAAGIGQQRETTNRRRTFSLAVSGASQVSVTSIAPRSSAPGGNSVPSCHRELPNELKVMLRPGSALHARGEYGRARRPIESVALGLMQQSGDLEKYVTPMDEGLTADEVTEWQRM